MIYKALMIMTCWVMVGTTGPLVMAQSTSGDPVSYTIDSPETVKAGEAFSITTTFSTQPGWYIYAPIDMNTAQGKIATNVSFEVPAGLKEIGGLELPNKPGFLDTYWGNDIRMSQKFQTCENVKPGKQTIKVNIIYQTCNDYICYPPVRKKIDVVVTVK
ncbi:Disulfide bond corrector protein DsbC [Mariniflexile rhizosphaerae]|uniref:protein-disulfide reductase DsbD domain-containing protein n=1 Tax=unclassified Mariniflexile TaxID=2643887 RepID=UPI000E33120A|nr:protein-disulfide reductase DsbD domain-containing protein [Mariniflexile sp. TRM1-10]AXP80861.1 Disulfide bond corrector protein DsbC [Mariniflexile sp. TRM1-10]